MTMISLNLHIYIFFQTFILILIFIYNLRIIFFLYEKSDELT